MLLDILISDLPSLLFRLKKNFIPKVSVYVEICLIKKVQDKSTNIIFTFNYIQYLNVWGTAVAQWLRCCATNLKVAGSISDGVIGIFHGHNSSNGTIALVSTQPLIEMSTRSIFWGVKAAGA